MPRTSPKLLTRDEEQALAVRIQADDRAALHELILRNDGLARMVARQWIDGHNIRGSDREDIHQECKLYLVEAARRFRPGLANFASYAPPFIRGRLLDRESRELQDHLHYAAHPQSSVRDGKPGAPPSPHRYDVACPERDEQASGPLMELLDDLPALMRQVVIRHLGLDGEAQSFQTLDRTMCLTTGSAYRLYGAALELLRQCYPQTEGERRSAA